MKNIELKDRGESHTQEEDKDKIYPRLLKNTHIKDRNVNSDINLF